MTITYIQTIFFIGDVYLAKKKDVIISSVTILLTDSNLKVGKVLMFIILSWAN